MCIQVALNLLPNSRSPPVVQWLHFRASVRKAMAFSSPQRDSKFFFIFFFSPERYFCFVLKRFSNEIKKNSIPHARSLISLQHISKCKISLSIKPTFSVHIGSVKFATLFKESSCSPVVTLPSFGSEGHEVQPPAEGFQIFFISDSQFKEFPCSPVLTFPSFGSEGHGA